MSTRHAKVATTLGEVTLVAAGDVVTGLYFPHHWYVPDCATFGSRVEGDALLGRAEREIEEYLGGRRREFDVPVAAAGDRFQHRVWDLVAKIPYGETKTYGELAAELADLATPGRIPAQEVGQAVGRNPLCLFVPCHRVVGAGGKITGYAGGVDRKRRLLELEAPAGRLF